MRSYADSGRPSSRTAPAVGSYILVSNLTRVLLPAPLSPTTAVTVPAGNAALTPRRIGLSPTDAFGYVNSTSVNSTPSWCRDGAGRPPPPGGSAMPGEAASVNANNCRRYKPSSNTMPSDMDSPYRPASQLHHRVDVQRDVADGEPAGTGLVRDVPESAGQGERVHKAEPRETTVM